jgi:hypothetical protein
MATEVTDTRKGLTLRDYRVRKLRLTPEQPAEISNRNRWKPRSAPAATTNDYRAFQRQWSNLNNQETGMPEQQSTQ